MALIGELKRRARDLVGPVLGLSALVYFVYHAVEGDRGLFAYFRLSHDIAETQLFYLESRGIPPAEARKFIVLGFLEPVVARVPLADAQDRLRELLEEKWTAGVATSDPSAASTAA